MPPASIIREFPFEIDERAVLRHQGYKPSSPVSDTVKELLAGSIDRASQFARPQGIWKIERIEEIGKEFVSISGGLEIHSEQVARLLKGCIELVLFAVTIGPETEDEAARLMEEGDGAESLMLDCVASEAVEGCANHVNKLVQDNAHRRGLHLTPRFSPGYGDWTVEHQSELFEALDPGRIGIKLTDSSMMIPRKSVSAIVGLGPIDAIRTGASPCKGCVTTQ